MKTTTITLIFLISIFSVYSQNAEKKSLDSLPFRNYSVSTTWLSFVNFGDEKTNTLHYELHVKYYLSSKDIIGVKAATWKLFATMGMPMQEQLKFDENNFYPGRLRESGIGITYQRLIWKGLFTTVEVLPQLKTYVDFDKNKIANGFKLYTSYHVGYQFLLCKGRMFIEPQMHCQYWPIDTNTPEAFKEIDDKWNNFFLFEPNLYIGFKF